MAPSRSSSRSHSRHKHRSRSPRRKHSVSDSDSSPDRFNRVKKRTRDRKREPSSSPSRSRSPRRALKREPKSISPRSSIYERAAVVNVKDSYSNWVKDGDDKSMKGFDKSYRYTSQQDEFSARRREQRCDLASHGCPSLWAVSPSRHKRHGLDSDDSTHEGGPKSEWAKYFKKKKTSLESEDDEKPTKKHKKHKKEKKAKKKHKKKKKEVASAEGSSSEDEWVEKGTTGSDAEEGLVGPLPKDEEAAAAADADNKNYSLYRLNMLPGEGEAMASYIADGKRIPRRGEIGLNSDDIKTYEDMGFVMSGTRHRRMEATRLRKENQIYSAEEKRMLSTFGHEERQKKEGAILSQFKNLVQKKVQQHQN